MIKSILKIDGMHCESCAKIIEMELKENPGVSDVNVDYKNNSAIIEYDEEKIALEKIIEVISGLGYQAKEE